MEIISTQIYSIHKSKLKITMTTVGLWAIFSSGAEPSLPKKIFRQCLKKVLC